MFNYVLTCVENILCLIFVNLDYEKFLTTKISRITVLLFVVVTTKHAGSGFWNKHHENGSMHERRNFMGHIRVQFHYSCGKTTTIYPKVNSLPPRSYAVLLLNIIASSRSLAVISCNLSERHFIVFICTSIYKIVTLQWKQQLRTRLGSNYIQESQVSLYKD